MVYLACAPVDDTVPRVVSSPELVEVCWLRDIVAGSRDWAVRDPMVEHVMIPGAGHPSNQDNPAAFTAALTAFLARVLPAGASRGSRRRRLRDLLRRLRHA